MHNEFNFVKQILFIPLSGNCNLPNYSLTMILQVSVQRDGH